MQFLSIHILICPVIYRQQYLPPLPRITPSDYIWYVCEVINVFVACA